MREEGSEAPHGDAAPQAFAFDGWSMVPLDMPARRSPERSEAEPEQRGEPA